MKYNAVYSKSFGGFHIFGAVVIEPRVLWTNRITCQQKRLDLLVWFDTFYLIGEYPSVECIQKLKLVPCFLV